MPFRTIAMAALTSGVTMCATPPPPPPEPPPPELEYTPGPDGLPIRHAPTEEVDAHALPTTDEEGVDGGE